ncbi:hypothetical protein [Streptomyces coeruleorubidus]|uniref:Uncharacterized protein n=1 Tax=Streptomyces coeruleorubidus TaxID=116188 RepID=A0A5J6IB50_STRC4|nr:hypothetical protein [Streptomyces coeruleorubidus]QEV29666.1 hypothetical protein CP976_39920 [Streptomyces coeruleorubidus]GGT98833.1 hypothetical protein GCM10010256_68500 [Streptomyces coeruleorubidus]
MITPTRTARTDEPASALLGTLAAQGASGAVSTEAGIVYLAAGHVVHVESALTPDVGDLLTHSGALAPDGWWQAIDQAGRRCRVGRQLVDSGHLAAGALELCHLGALFDAAYFVLAHDGPVLRFRPGVSHWLGAVRAVPVDTVLRESRRRRELLHRIWPEATIDLAPLARVTGTGPADLPARRSRTLAQVDGVRTAAQIATALACRTFHTLVELRRLAAAGLVVPKAPALATAPVPAPAPAPAPVSAEPGPAPRPTAPDEPDTALLRRLLHALEAL